MTWTAIAATYFVAWWVVLFAVLPFGTRTQEEAGEVILGTASSAPERPRLVRAAIATSIVAAIVVGVIWGAIDVYGLSLETFANMFDVTRQ